jgi:hypothetical protein
LHFKIINEFTKLQTQSRANPTIASYNASVVKIYSPVNIMARF